MGKATISDVAAKSGCSRTTISRYLNGKYEFMSEDTREKIEQVIKEIGYKPNLIARNLRLQESKTIAVLVSDITNTFSSILYSGIAEESESAGYTLLMANTNDDPGKELKYIQSMIDQSVDGIILNASGENQDYIRHINEEQIPIVLVDRPVPLTNCDLVTSDSDESVREMMLLLKEKGYTDVYWITKRIGKNGTRIARANAYEKHYKDLFKKVPQICEYDNGNEKDLEIFIKKVYKDTQEKECKTALFTANGVVLRSVVKQLKVHGIIFPDELGLCSFDNWPWMELIGPGLTVIEQETYKMGKKSVKQLIKRMDGAKAKKPASINIKCKLIDRGSI